MIIQRRRGRDRTSIAWGAAQHAAAADTALAPGVAARASARELARRIMGSGAAQPSRVLGRHRFVAGARAAALALARSRPGSSGLQVANAHPTSGNLATFDYAYDLNQSTGAYDRLGQRVSMTANVPSQSLTNAFTKYSYDVDYQLTQAVYPAAAPFNGETHSWTYDAIGNRLTNTVNGTTTSYTYQKIGTNPNNWQRLTSDGANSYTYDANGNALTQGTSTFGWDYENRLTSISGGATASYSYDFQGRRTGKTVSGTASTYVYDGLNLVSDSSTATTYYLYGPGIDEPLALSRAGAVSYYSSDGLGSIALATDGTDAVQASYGYDAWGVARTTTETVPQPIRYTGREAGELGTLFYRARFYLPTAGRFLSEDPLDMLAGVNFYAYVLSQPTIFRDPLGMAPDYGTCLSGCIAQYRFSNLYTLAAHTANAWANRAVGMTGRTGVGGVPSHPTSWAHKVGSRYGPTASRAGRLVGRMTIALTVFEGFYDIGTIGRCAVVCMPDGPCN